MELLAEDPTYLAGGLGLLGAIFLIVLKVTQQGRYLIRALIALGLAAIVLLVEWYWVTDNERIEQVVENLRRAVAASDSAAVFAQLTPEVEYSQSGQTLSGAAVRKFIGDQLSRAEFDFVRITQLETNAGRQSGRGSAVFRVVTSGSYQTDFGRFNFGSNTLDFSLGFQQTKPGVWLVDRISLTRPPREMPSPGGTAIPKESRPTFEFRRPRFPTGRKDRVPRKRFSIPVPEESPKSIEAPPKTDVLPNLDRYDRLR